MWKLMEKAKISVSVAGTDGSISMTSGARSERNGSPLAIFNGGIDAGMLLYLAQSHSGSLFETAWLWVKCHLEPAEHQRRLSKNLTCLSLSKLTRGSNSVGQAPAGVLQREPLPGMCMPAKTSSGITSRRENSESSDTILIDFDMSARAMHERRNWKTATYPINL